MNPAAEVPEADYCNILKGNTKHFSWIPLVIFGAGLNESRSHKGYTPFCAGVHVT